MASLLSIIDEATEITSEQVSSRKRTLDDFVNVKLVALHKISDVVSRQAWIDADAFRALGRDVYLWEFISALDLPTDTGLFAYLCFTLFTLLAAQLAGDKEEEEEEDDDDEDEIVTNECCFALHVIQVAIYDVCARNWKHLRHHVFRLEAAMELTGVSNNQWSCQSVVFACTSSIEAFIAEHLPRWSSSDQRHQVTQIYLRDRRRDNFLRDAHAAFFDANDNDKESLPVVMPCDCPKELDIRELCANPDISKFTQVECTLAVQALCRRWRAVYEFKYAWRIWRYINLLQQRCFLLWMTVDHQRTVANGSLQKMVHPTTTGWEVASVWITHIATVLLHARRVQCNVMSMFTLTHIERTIEHRDCAAFIDQQCFAGRDGVFHQLVRGFYRWIRKQAANQAETVVCEALINTVIKNTFYRFGDKEEHMRMNNNDCPIQAYERLGVTNSRAQVEWMMNLGEIRIHDFFDRVRVPFICAEFMTLELFKAYMLHTEGYQWMENAVLRETALLRDGGKRQWRWGVKRHPFIFQVFGGFALITQGRCLCMQFAAQAVVAWIALVLHECKGQVDTQDSRSVTGRSQMDLSSTLKSLIAEFSQEADR